ncbi:ninein-like protein isoform X2 [Lytechinus variegatus]|uniref:ninein-like protein isoform X2 n=1 Tax=Lytechinus variegatus TaxID=7654 RepID=UPI001BB17B91|nr:ninein-like protein isoform X2 [Lytechinus variegatus]
MDESDEDVYVSQLKELFAGCDTKGLGRLGAAELTELCSKLQLEGQVDLLLEQLLGNDTSKTVDFDTFKEAFVMVLSSTVDLDGVEVGTDIDQEYSMGSFPNSADLIDEVSPKYVKDGRRYGRRSRIDFDVTADFSEVDDDLISNEPKSLAEELGPMQSYHESSEQSANRKSKSYVEENIEAPEIEHDDRRSHSHSVSHRSNPPEPPQNETFEAEGQMNASMSVYDQGQSEAEQVQAIWEEVGVGKDGFLDINELAVVCEHIGMEDMDRTELKNLFNKLDRDEDGKVGFEEFLDGLFRTAGIRTPAPLTPLSLAPTPSLLSSQIAAKRRMQVSVMDEPMYRTATPSLLMAQPITKLFSVLDANNAGFTTMDAVSEQLMEQGIYNPQEVLEALDIYPDVSGRINLEGLSMALDNILMTAGENNGVYQAALTSYQSELKYLRSLNDQLTTERDKLKMDIAEANRQNSSLVQEIDDRHANIEKTNETKLRDMERKYQEKINSLQAEIEKEREMISSQATNQTTKLLDEMEQLKGDEALSKERLQNIVEDNNRLEQDLNDAMEKLLEYEKTITKQQRDLDGFSELEERLAELETSRDGVSKQQEVYYEQSLRDMQEHMRTLQDQLDETSQENELLKHQASERKVRRKGSKLQGGPRRGGSVLSDYTNKPSVVKRNLNSSSDNDDSELDELDPKSKRRLPQVSGIPEEEEEDELSGEIQKRLEEEKAKLEAKIESLKEQHLEEMEETKETFETEIKEIEKRYRQEMREMEERFEQESAKLANDLQENEKHSEEEKVSLAMQFEEEKAQLMEEFEGEKAALEQAFEIMKTELEETLKNEFADELNDRLAEQAAKFDEERLSLEGALTNDKSKLVSEIQQVREDGESKLRNLKMELEVQHLEEKEDLESKFEEAREDLRRQLREKQNELDSILDDGEVGLKGQLKEDFILLLDQHKQVTENDFLEKLEVEKEALSLQLQKERQEMQDEFDKEKYELSDAVSGEKSDLLDHFQRETDEMIEKHQRERNEAEERFKADRNKMADKHRKEIDDLMRMNEETIDDLKKQHAKAIDKLQKEKNKLEEKLEKEKRRLEERMKTDKERWEEENAKLKLRHEQELQQAMDEAERERNMMEMAVRVEVQRDVKKEVTDEYEEKMDQVKTEFEDEKAEMIAENEMLQNKLRMAEVAKEEAVVAIQMQTQEAALQQARPDRTKLIALETEKSRLKMELEDLNKKYINMQMQVSVASSQHSRELERVRQKQTLEFQGELGHLREELAQRDGRIKELDRQIREKAEELKRALSIGKETEGSEVRKMRRGKEEAEKKYRKMRAMLEEYMKKLKDQLAKTTRHDVLLKELYVENSKLQRTLQLTEERQKTAERNCHNLVEKNQAYLNILKKVCPAAV